MKDGMSGGGGSERNGKRHRVQKDLLLPLKVTLEDLYKGTTKKLSFSQNVICHKCKGTGETIIEKDCCLQCQGKKFVQHKKVLKAIIEKGMQHGQQIIFTVDGDEAVDADLVFVLQQEVHPRFKRRGHDLIYKHRLSLSEALCGFQFVLIHLDDRQLFIKSHLGQVVKPNQYKRINNEGMPIYEKPFMRGKLYIHFTVDFPDSLTPELCKSLEQLLPKPASDMQLDECEETSLSDVDTEEV